MTFRKQRNSLTPLTALTILLSLQFLRPISRTYRPRGSDPGSSINEIPRNSVAK